MKLVMGLQRRYKTGNEGPKKNRKSINRPRYIKKITKKRRTVHAQREHYTLWIVTLSDCWFTFKNENPRITALKEVIRTLLAFVAVLWQSLNRYCLEEIEILYWRHSLKIFFNIKLLRSLKFQLILKSFFLLF